MAKDIFFGNVMPSQLNPVSTGNPKADAAIRQLQAFEVYPHGKPTLPTGPAFAAAKKAAEALGPEKLLALLDDAALQTGVSKWSDDHKAKLGAADKKAFQKHYDEVLKAVATRRAYLNWLIGAVCVSPSGLDRAVQIIKSGTVAAREAAKAAVARELKDPKAILRYVELMVPTKEGTKAQVETSLVALLNKLDPRAAFEKFSPFLAPAAVKAKGGVENAEAVLFGLRATPPDPQWTSLLLPHIQGPLDNVVFILLNALPPDERVVEPLCAYLPKPTETKKYWNDTAVKALGRSANKSAVPWLTGALWASWMNWPAAFEGFQRAKDPSAVNVMLAWLEKNDAPDRRKAAAPILKELRALGPVPEAAPRADDRSKPEPKQKRPTLTFKKVGAYKAPKLQPVAKVEAELRGLFKKAGLEKHFDAIAQRAVFLIPTRVDEAKLALGATKLGGHPDLEASAKWPRVRGEPLTFLAQLDLADYAPSLPKGALPTSGLISFFMGNVGGSERAGYCENAVVLFTKPGAKLVRHEVPDDFFDVIYQACSVKLHETISLPSYNNVHVTSVLKGDAGKYGEHVWDETQPMIQVFGYREHGYDAEAKRSEQMLLQLPGDNQTDMEFGDVDAVSFYVDKKKLAAGDFKKVSPKIGD